MPTDSDLNIHSDEINALFIEALAAISDDDIAQLSFEQFSNPGAREELTILFDLALESIEDPTAQDRYVDVIQTSEKAKVHSSELMKQFERIQKAFELPQLTMKALRSMWTHGPEIEELDLSSGRRGVRRVSGHVERSGMSFIPASGSEAFAAFFADLAIFLPLTLFITLILSFLNGLSLENLGDMLQSFSFIASIAYLRTLVLVVAVLGLAYALVHALFHGRTPGMSVLGLRFRTLKGSEPSRSALTIRVLVWPLSFLLGGVIAIALGKKSLHDLASNTYIGKPGIAEPQIPEPKPA